MARSHRPPRTSSSSSMSPMFSSQGDLMLLDQLAQRPVSVLAQMLARNNVRDPRAPFFTALGPGNPFVGQTGTPLFTNQAQGAPGPLSAPLVGLRFYNPVGQV